MKSYRPTSRTKKIVLSGGIAALFLVITLCLSNTVLPFGSEKTFLQYYEYTISYLGWGNEYTQQQEEMEDSVELIDTHYAQTLVMAHEDNLNIGKEPVTDRKLLKELLDSLKKWDNYKYIILDIALDKHDRQEEDSSLYTLIDSMRDIVIALPENTAGNISIADTCLLDKAGTVEYGVAQWEDDFVKYPFKIRGKKSLALKMYEDLKGDTLKHFGPFLCDNGLARSSAIILFDLFYYDSERLHPLENLNYESLKNSRKYIIIGDMQEDIHTTYAGDLPGSIINFNAYLTLANGHHRISFSLVVILFLVFFFLCYYTLNQSEFTWLFMWIGYPIFLYILCFFIYYLYDEVYDILAMSFLFYLLKTAVECIRKRETIYQRIKSIWIHFGTVWRRMVGLHSHIVNKTNIIIKWIRNIFTSKRGKKN